MDSACADEQKSEGVLNRLLAPGPLMEGHQELESSDCLKCHEVGKGISIDKCLDCHKEIRAAVSSKKGFHGLTKETCIHCHSDHKGRENDTTRVDEKSFDHAVTGYKLEGKHAELKCEKCHTGKRTKKTTRKTETHYFGAKSTCLECHKKDDIHHFTGNWAKFDCGKCHGLKSWKENVKFDHAHDTNFALEGKHAELKCEKCHKDGKYLWPNLKKGQCLACHEDFHKKNLSPKFSGGDCTKCHSQTKWKIPSFDHGVTGYPLKGKHAEIQCIRVPQASPGNKPEGDEALQVVGPQIRLPLLPQGLSPFRRLQVTDGQRCESVFELPYRSKVE